MLLVWKLSKSDKVLGGLDQIAQERQTGGGRRSEIVVDAQTLIQIEGAEAGDGDKGPVLVDGLAFKSQVQFPALQLCIRSDIGAPRPRADVGMGSAVPDASSTPRSVLKNGLVISGLPLASEAMPKWTSPRWRRK